MVGPLHSEDRHLNLSDSLFENFDLVVRFISDEKSLFTVKFNANGYHKLVICMTRTMSEFPVPFIIEVANLYSDAVGGLRVHAI